MSHVGRNKEALSNGSIVVRLFSRWERAIKHSLSYLNRHVTISSLSRLRAYFFMIEQHYHVTFSIVRSSSLVLVNQRVEGHQRAT